MRMLPMMGVVDFMLLPAWATGRILKVMGSMKCEGIVELDWGLVAAGFSSLMLDRAGEVETVGAGGGCLGADEEVLLDELFFWRSQWWILVMVWEA